tara:strand:- start:16968 stop:17198 length:231 start_codon:yes stop_codon:yes gene_type:complete
MALSKTQTKRLGGILSIMFGDNIPSENLTELIKQGYIEVVSQGYKLTAKGLDEKNRLCTLCGLNIMYSSEKKETLK